MFNLSIDQPIELEITVSHPGVSLRFVGLFSPVRVSQLTELTADNSGGDAAFVRKVLVGWSGLKDVNGKEIPFTPKARDALLDRASVVSAIAKRYFKELSEGVLNPEKN